VNDGRIFNVFFIANLLLSVKVKESYDLAKLWQKIKRHFFFGYGVVAYINVTHSVVWC